MSAEVKQPPLKNTLESLRVAQVIHAELQQCYHNAFFVVTTLDEYHGADYVEGYAIVGNGPPLEHGWIERDGEIIDPTFTTVDTTYFGGLRFHGAEELTRKLKELPKTAKDDLPLFYCFGWGGSGSPEMMQAWTHVEAYLKLLHLRSET